MNVRDLRSASRRLGSLPVLLLLSLLLVLALSAPAMAATFTDVPASHPYATAIQDMASLGIVNGFADGRFKPDAPVARQQFAKMIVKFLELPVYQADAGPFWDVDHGIDPHDALYPDKYIASCAGFGITTGFTATSFHPYSDISLAQLITMVARAASLPATPSGYSPPFNNFDPTHFPWAKRAAFAGLLDNIWGPVGGTSQFWEPATRGEVCQVLENLKEWPADHEQKLADAIETSGMLSSDFDKSDIWEYQLAANWAGAIVVIPGQPDSSVLFHHVGDEWQVVNAASNISAQEWVGLGAPKTLALYLARTDDLAAIADVLRATGSFDVAFQISGYLFEGPDAGIVLSSPNLENCFVYMLRGLIGWAPVDFGTGITYEDWIADGAPAGVAQFLSGLAD